MAEMKIFVGNISPKVTSSDLERLFEQYGKVAECDIIKNYGFVHMASEEEVKRAVQSLNNYMFMGTTLHVEFSTSKVRPKAGMGRATECFKCGKRGHWSKDCPRGGGSSEPRGRGPPPPPPRGYGGDRYASSYPPPPPPPSYRDPYYDRYDRRIPPPPPPGYRERDRSPYARRPPSPGYGRRPPSPGRYPYDLPPRPRDPYDSMRRRSPPPPMPRGPPPPMPRSRNY